VSNHSQFVLRRARMDFFSRWQCVFGSCN